MMPRTPDAVATSAKEGRRRGRVIHTGQVIVDLTMRVEAMPEPGGDVFADESGIHVGGGFNVAYAARQLEVETLYAGTMGSGPFADAAIDGLAAIGVKHTGMTLPEDLGYCVAITDASAERTFISTRGAETRDPLDAFDRVELREDDVLYLTGYSLSHAANRSALERLAGRLRPPVRAVFDVSPMIGQIPLESLEKLSALDPIWSMNEREALVLGRRLGVIDEADGTDGGEDIGAAGADDGAAGAGENSDGSETTALGSAGEDARAGSCFAALLAEKLSRRLGQVVLRTGPGGAWYAAGERATHIPTITVRAVDTNGAGDAHSGVLCAALARGEELHTALIWANVAGALSTTVSGPATCPTWQRIRDAATGLSPAQKGVGR